MTPGHIRVGGYYVRIEPPVTLPRYDVYALMGAFFGGFSLGVVLLTAAVVYRLP